MRRTGIGVLAVALGGAACFTGDGTLGAICRDDADCGGDQTCSNEVCGLCGDGLAQPGELCLVEAAALATAPAASPSELVGVDLDRDATIDLLTRDEDGRPVLWSGDGSGGWSVATVATGVGSRGAMALADLDGDEVLDLVVADDDALALHVGYGGAELGWAFLGAFGLPEARAVLDLAVAGATEGAPAWVAWVDDGGLVQSLVDPGQGPLGMARRIDSGRVLRVGTPATIDGDPELDLPVLDVDGMQLEIWWGDGTGQVAVAGEPIALPARPVEVAVVDVDGDGDVDLLVPDEQGGITVITGDGEGRLAEIERAEVPGPAGVVTVADLNRDGERDLVALAADGSAAWALLGRGFRHRDAIALPVGAAAGAVLVVDGDRDGLVEILLGPSSGPAPLEILEVEP